MRPLSQQWHRFCFYTSNALQDMVPGWWYRRSLSGEPARLSAETQAMVAERVAYYLRLTEPFPVPDAARCLRDITPDGYTTYYFDLRRILRYFPTDRRVAYRFGDIREVPPQPAVVKSRPIGDHNHNAVLLKLNQVRHYYFVADQQSYANKRDVVVWRGKCHANLKRTVCVERYAATPGCDIGDMNPNAVGQSTWKPYLPIVDQLTCKFILSIEGNDVATNTKWIMASNSLCFMARPRFETWFMEGRLIPGQHYVLLRDDYADLMEKRDHYLSHPHEALAIIANAQRHVSQFRDQRLEHRIGLEVMRRYFQLSGQEVPVLPA